MAKRAVKKPSKKVINQSVWDSRYWVVKYGKLMPGRGRPSNTQRLFRYVAEKVPYEALEYVKYHFVSDGTSSTGVYVAHDSMGAARYIGRGNNVFSRLATHKKQHPHEIVYFSLYIVEDKKHEREIETLLIRAAGPLLEFNQKKKNVGINSGNIQDYEPGTHFYERQAKKGRKRARK